MRTTKKLRPSKPVALDAGDAFVPDLARTRTRLTDDEAEAFAEEFIACVTSGEDVGEDARDEVVDEEIGGPFLELPSEVERRELAAQLRKRERRPAI